MTCLVRSLHWSSSQAHTHSHTHAHAYASFLLLCVCVSLPQKVGHSLEESSWRKWWLPMTQPNHAFHSTTLQWLRSPPSIICSPFYILFILYHSDSLFSVLWLFFQSLPQFQLFFSWFSRTTENIYGSLCVCECVCVYVCVWVVDSAMCVGR